jgi:hypothetical protein
VQPGEHCIVPFFISMMYSSHFRSFAATERKYLVNHDGVILASRHIARVEYFSLISPKITFKTQFFVSLPIVFLSINPHINCEFLISTKPLRTHMSPFFV